MTQPGDELELVGTTLEGKYAVEAVVGEGGFATVYRATHTVLQRPVALKVFRALEGFSEADRRALAKGFVQEAAVLAELSERSAAILQARDVGMLATRRGEHLPYMVLEWLEGQTLEHVLEAELAEKLPLRTMDHAVRLLDPIGEALALAHSKGIAHRDVKPSNIFVLKGGLGVKLLDFGIAKIVEDTQQSVGAFAKTAGHVSSFTPAYGAPEQFSREYGATGPWTDVFALALVLVEMVTGKPALEGDSFVQLGMAAAHPKVRPTPRTRGATVSDAVEHVFAKALAVSPKDRWQSAGEMWSALSAAVGAERRSALADHTVLVEIGSRPQAVREALAVASAKPAQVVPDLELPVPPPSAPRSRPMKAAPAAT
jgi:serine/threonine protein kinase